MECVKNEALRTRVFLCNSAGIDPIHSFILQWCVLMEAEGKVNTGKRGGRLTLTSSSGTVGADPRPLHMIVAAVPSEFRSSPADLSSPSA